MFPDDCIQYLAASWWEEVTPPKRERWRLVNVYVRHITAAPYEVVLTGRREARDHSGADLTVGAFRADQRQPMTPLPIAAIPNYPQERFTLNRGKMRPALIIATPGTTIDRAVRSDIPKAHYTPTYIVAPYYTAEPTGSQAGVPQEFIRQVKRCEFTQCFWDMLPLTKGHPGSILRLDQIQAVEPDINSLKATEWMLSEEAQGIVHEMLLRHLTQIELDPDGPAAVAVDAIKSRPDIP